MPSSLARWISGGTGGHNPLNNILLVGAGASSRFGVAGGARRAHQHFRRRLRDAPRIGIATPISRDDARCEARCLEAFQRGRADQIAQLKATQNRRRALQRKR